MGKSLSTEEKFGFICYISSILTWLEEECIENDKNFLDEASRFIDDFRRAFPDFAEWKDRKSEEYERQRNLPKKTKEEREEGFLERLEQRKTVSTVLQNAGIDIQSQSISPRHQEPQSAVSAGGEEETMEMEIGGERYITYSSAQKMLGGVCHSTVQRIVARHNVRTVRLSRKKLLNASDLLNWLTVQPKTAVVAPRRGRPRRF